MFPVTVNTSPANPLNTAAIAIGPSKVTSGLPYDIYQELQWLTI
jgi:hypothetical protein